MEGAEQVFRALVDPLEGVLDVVERVGRVDDADRLERRAQRGSTLQVDVDVAGLDEREAVRVGAELARRIQLDGEADVGLLETLLEQLDAAVVVRRLLVLARRDAERDGFARRGASVAVLSGVPPPAQPVTTSAVAASTDAAIRPRRVDRAVPM